MFCRLLTCQTAPTCFTGPHADRKRTRLARQHFFDGYDMDSKDDIRQYALKHRARMENTPDLEEAVFRNFTTQFSLSTLKDKNIGLYWPMGYELDCSLIIEHLLKNDIALSFPKVTANTRVLEFYLWNGKDKMVTGTKGTVHPSLKGKSAVLPDIVITPLVAFDRNCYRLGRGGGYYDATIAHLRQQNKSLIVAGLAFDTQLCLFPLPCEAHDEKLDIIITPNTVYNSN